MSSHKVIGAYGKPIGLKVMNMMKLILREILQIAAKSLILHDFKSNPKKLWITLLKTVLGSGRGLDFQALRWIAHHLSKINLLNKNNDLTLACSFDFETHTCIQASKRA
jgi:hypothetical protein